MVEHLAQKNGNLRLCWKFVSVEAPRSGKDGQTGPGQMVAPHLARRIDRRKYGQTGLVVSHLAVLPAASMGPMVLSPEPGRLLRLV